MEDIVFAVVPVRERGMVRAGLLDRLGWLANLLLLRFSTRSLFALVFGLVSCGKVHGVRIDNFSLFLQIESLFVALHLSLGQLSVVVLSVV